MSDRALPGAPLRLAVAQAQAAAGDLTTNLATVADMILEAGRQGAALVVFPEKFLSGYEPDLIASNPAQYALLPGDPRLEPVRQACRAAKVSAVVGAATLDGDVRISVLVLDRQGQEVARYSKRALFSSEGEIFTAGREACLLQLDSWTIGLGICYDAGFPEHARALAQAGSHVYLVSSLFSQGNGHHESRVWFPARALDNTMYAVMANHVGTTGGWAACGSSAVWDPMGRLVAEADPAQQALLVVDLDADALRHARRAEPMLSDLAGLNLTAHEAHAAVL